MIIKLVKAATDNNYKETKRFNFRMQTRDWVVCLNIGERQL